MISKDEIIRMAREAKWSGLYTQFNEPTGQSDWKMVKTSLNVPVTWEQIERFASLVAAHTQEQCAKVCEKEAELSVGSDADGCYGCANAIRAMK